MGRERGSVSERTQSVLVDGLVLTCTYGQSVLHNKGLHLIEARLLHCELSQSEKPRMRVRAYPILSRATSHSSVSQGCLA